jgi:hypothetical protein
MHVYGLDHRKNITTAAMLNNKGDNDVCGIIFLPDQRGLEPSGRKVKCAAASP